MDPITLIVTALATGAVAGLKPTAEKVVKDAYEGLKKIIVDKYERSKKTLPVLEDDPASEVRKDVVRESLKEENAEKDEDLVRQAQAVLKAVEGNEEVAAEAGVQIRHIKAGASVSIRDIISKGYVEIEDIIADDDVTIEGLRVGSDAARGKGGSPEV